MARRPADPLLRFVRRLAASDSADATDGQLLARFVVEQDERAFAVLLQRHGPMVLGVCRRALRDPRDVEDAFQATFLVLVRKANSLRKPESLANWLYGVALRTALKARQMAARRCMREKALEDVAVPEAEADVSFLELRSVLDEELQRLPARYRVPLILCELEGKTHAEAGLALDCPRETITTRLVRGRERLRRRLIQRGLTLSAVSFATILTSTASSAGVPAELAGSAAQNALLLSTSKTAVAGTNLSRLLSLTEGVLRTMLIAKLKIGAVILLALVLLVGGSGVLTFHNPAAGAGDTPAAQTPAPASDESAEPVERQIVPSPYDGIIAVIGTEIREGEQVPPDRVIAIKIGDDVKKYRRLRKGDAVEAGQLVGRLDDRLARQEVALKKTKLAASLFEQNAAAKTRDETYQRWLTAERLAKANGAISQEEVRERKLTYERYASEAQSRKAAVEVAKLELAQAETMLEMYELRSAIRGVIKEIYKQRGEAVKSLEPVMLIHGTKEQK